MTIRYTQAETSRQSDVSRGLVENDRLREWTAVLVDDLTGVAREVRVMGRDEADAVMSVALEMTDDESLDSLVA